MRKKKKKVNRIAIWPSKIVTQKHLLLFEIEKLSIIYKLLQWIMELWGMVCYLNLLFDVYFRIVLKFQQNIKKTKENII